MSYSPRYYDALIEALYQKIVQLKSVEECQRFFDDLCTISEIQSMSQRYKVAEMLDANETYASIEHVTGASTATISRISKSLNGKAGGYRLMLNRQE